MHRLDGSLFYIVLDKPQPHLDEYHTIYGKVIEGIDFLKDLEKYGSRHGGVSADVRIVESGVLPHVHDEL